jgi:L-threonylcarbamoyladenylate synthase
VPRASAPIVPFERIDDALSVLRSGGLVVLPTDTVYGVAGLLGDARAVQRTYRAAGRTADGTLPLLLADGSLLPRVAAAVPAAARRLAGAFWPGALTLLLRRAPGLRGTDDAGELVAVRVPEHAAARALLEAVGGALLVVSVGERLGPQPRTAAAAAAVLGRRVGLILDGGVAVAGAPSCLVDCSRERPRLLRQGAIPAERLARAALVKDL